MDENEQTVMWTQAYLQWLDLDVNPDTTQRDVLREAMRLVASRGEADRQRIAEALSEAENLLQDERGAWRALNALRVFDPANGAGGDLSIASEAAFDAIAAELHALAGKMMALRSGAL